MGSVASVHCSLPPRYGLLRGLQMQALPGLICKVQYNSVPLDVRSKCLVLLSLGNSSGHGGFTGVNSGPALQALVEEGDAGLLPSIMEVYARPTRIVRGKEVSADWAADEALFELEEEHALWAAYQATCQAVHPALGVESFLQVSAPAVP